MMKRKKKFILENIIVQYWWGDEECRFGSFHLEDNYQLPQETFFVGTISVISGRCCCYNYTHLVV